MQTHRLLSSCTVYSLPTRFNHTAMELNFLPTSYKVIFRNFKDPFTIMKEKHIDTRFLAEGHAMN